MGWICCGGFGSCGRWGWLGIGPLGWKPAISVAGCRSRTSRSGLIGGVRAAMLAPWRVHLTGPSVNAVTGKAMRGSRYAAATVAHCETVLRGFYDFHLEAGTGPMVNPFPLDRYRGAGRVDAHHNPMEPFSGHRSGR